MTSGHGKKVGKRVIECDNQMMRKSGSRAAAERGNDAVRVGGLGRVAVGKDGDITALSQNPAPIQIPKLNKYKSCLSDYPSQTCETGLLRSKRAQGCLHPIKPMPQLGETGPKGLC